MLMKKFLSLFLCLTCLLTLVACGKKVAPITLPQTDEITSIDITFGENTVSHSDKTWISEIIADISSSEPTKKESVQDCPQVESYIKIDFQFETGTSTIFAYEDSGKYYIEQPYQGIYKIDSQLFERLQETDYFQFVEINVNLRKRRMEDKKILLDNINKIHTTEMGVDRIKRNLKIDTVDVVEYCKNKIVDENCHIYKQGKNWYCEIENIKITINSYSYTIITAHIIN